MTRTTMILAIAVLFMFANRGMADPCQVDRLVAPGPFAPTSFGNSIAHSGDYWFIADYRAQVLCTGFGCGAGAVYVYEMVEGELVYVQTLTSPFPQVADNYGFALAADGERLFVSARFGGFSHRPDRPGAVFVYKLQDGQWVLSTTIEPLSGSAKFGTSLAIDQNLLAVSDFDRDRVLVFERWPDDSWQMVDVLSPPSDVAPSSWFGVALAVSGDTITVGAPFDRSRIANGGSVHIYLRNSTGSFDRAQSLYAEVPERFGWSIAIGWAGIILVGAPNASRHFEEQGVIYELALDPMGWTIHDEVVSEDPGRRDDFGSTLSLAAGRLFVGAPSDGLGSVQWFEKLSGHWEQYGRVTADAPTFSRAFGYSHIANDGVLLVGAPDESDIPGSPVYGAAYHFDLTCNPCPVDLDADGALTIFDFLTFLNLFQDGDATADFDGDGELTIFDFLAFQTAFDAGCE